MENVNPTNAIPPATEPRLKSAKADKLKKNEPAQQIATIKVARKRTKTGCLTCRQRRIKCGEEKPICKNCTKSKRECKGYAQRLIFKNPLGIPGVPNPIPTQSQPLPNQYEGQIDLQHLTSAGTHGPILAPKLRTISDLEQQPAPQFPVGYKHDMNHDDAVFAKEFTVPAQTLLPEARTRRAVDPSAPHYQPKQEHVGYDQYSISEPGQAHQALENWTHQGLGPAEFPQPSQIPQKFVPGPMPYESKIPTQQYVEQQPRTLALIQSGPSFTPLSPFEYMDDDDDDDPYDVETDEEAEEQSKIQNLNQLSMVMASANRDENQLRLFTTYLDEPNMLATYQPTYSSSPLNNPKTARIFLHFIHSTGPALSVFERHPIDPSIKLGAAPAAQQGLWTYTLPLKAFEHAALQQAMLALSSLHIAYLQGTSSAVSLKHYQYALRRVGKAVGLPGRRKQLGTLAASLLLAFYEVMTADHIKWNNHLAGSAQLLREIDYAGLTRDLRAQRRSRWLRQSHAYNSFMDSFMFNDPASSEDPFAELENEVDENMVGIFLGRAVNYDQFGQVEGEHTSTRNRRLTRKDIETFRIQCDLYWWFVKQDWLQSIISGGPLFLPFSYWGLCPPRGGLGRVDAIYASADHLSLLMGRLADFGVRDRKRKLMAAKASGPGGWQPDSKFGMFMARYGPPRPKNPGQGTFGAPPPGATGPPPSRGPPPQAHTGNEFQGFQGGNMNSRGSSGGSPGPSSIDPPMYGMVPSTGPRRLPPDFATSLDDRKNFPGRKDEDIDVSYEAAGREWEDIFAAFDAFEQSLGPDYMPLPADSTMPIHSPFGPALQYRTHNMGSLWAFYYIGRILLLRLHPSMHPAMMVAAGYASAATAHHAQTMGRIAAGVYGPQSQRHGAKGFSPTLGACLIEVTVGLFFAAVQYVDREQRNWTIAVLNDVSRLTGIKSSEAIARGCRTAWTAASKRPGGPPYEPDTGIPEPPAWNYYKETEANTERRWVAVPKQESPILSWAMGILSLEDNVNEGA
ncbi:hypothetical protein BJY01DRAFT_120520 [Aspergillus pseudoustus]|uniref:Zn(2)-C6 fungal-type domain-containing protein n=1 Tax=Aspergillus pseudoustus TaxID=1810923 RepID=A0ABR4IRG9_9EURO